MENADPWHGLEQDLEQQWTEWKEWVSDYEKEENAKLRKYDKTGNGSSESAGRTEKPGNG